ncbi:TIGR04197 family type VII secretion effector [Paenilisteria rocourtiae]|uniref:Type VII secretion effector (TIGR04197 family) n=1 Tax=Listeria rocourtiae TaxID=647910 RepID=A0A4R6ZPZ6_9LIST|nr:TIGR04197 family type VII secretion effector [Listeria rocourtiae]MBC1604158.1 TIGR04197 family type VII secretion effector [Listeria rocourtiae]TDR54661.1 type VII secretion effector (TIGR04197 family) [Listeria rocourtiae]
MSKLQSDLDGASLKATALKNATDSLISSVSITTDSQTTVAGNKSAGDSIKMAQEVAQQIASAVATASSNIQSVASSFEAVDKKAGQGLEQSIGEVF